MSIRSSSNGAADPAGLVHRRRWYILSVLVVSLLVVVLDNTVLNVALPRIQQELGATQGQQEWIIDAYTLVFAALLFTYGVLCDRIGRRRVLLWGLALFGIGSAASAYSSSPDVLIAMRALMGVGGAAVFPATLAIITNVFDDRERGRAIAIWAGATGLSVSIGPLVGGSLLDAGFWWGSVFLINVPIVLLGLVGIVLLVPESKDPKPSGLDPTGVVLSVAGLFALVYGLIRGGETSNWTSASVLGGIVGGLAILAGFIWYERHAAHPALDVAWFANRAFTAASTAVALAFFALFALMLYGSYFLQFDRGYSPLGAGYIMLANAIALGVFAPLSALLVPRLGARVVAGGGLLLLSISYAAFAFVGHHTSLVVIEVLLFLMGVGMANMMATATETIMAALPRARAGAGSAVNSTMRQVGGALGVAVLGSVLSTVYRSHISGALQSLPPRARHPAGESIGATQAVVRTIAARLPDHGSALLQSASDSFISAMHVAALLSALAVLVGAVIAFVWLPRRPAPTQRPEQEPATSVPV